MSKWYGYESRKNWEYLNEVKSPILINGQSAAKHRIGERSTTNCKAASDWQFEVVGIQMDEDIVCNQMRVWNGLANLKHNRLNR